MGLDDSLPPIVTILNPLSGFGKSKMVFAVESAGSLGYSSVQSLY